MENDKNKEKITLYSYYELGTWIAQLEMQKTMKESGNEKFKESMKESGDENFNQSITFFLDRLNRKLEFLDIDLYVNYASIAPVSLENEIQTAFKEPLVYEKQYAFSLGHNILMWQAVSIATFGESNIPNIIRLKNDISICLKALKIENQELLDSLAINQSDFSSIELFVNNINAKLYYFHQLIKMYLDEREIAMKKQEEHRASIQIGSFINHGSFVMGDAIDSTFSVDNSIYRIEQQIEEKGGEDVEDLKELLSEVRELMKSIESSGSVPKQNDLFKKLFTHFAKHGWFYTEIVELLGKQVISMLRV